MAKEEEIESALKEARYILNKRSGFIQSTNYSEILVKKVISIAFLRVQFLKNIFNGDIFNVGHNGKHPVYRYAKTLWLEV